jgi:putative transposase
VKIRGELLYLWRAVDQDGDVIDILVQRHRNVRAAKRFFRKLLRGQKSKPSRIVTDMLRSYSAAHRVAIPSVDSDTRRYANNRAEVSHQPTENENV